MRPSLLGLGLLAPTASLGQVVVTVWVGTGDCSPTGGTNGSGAGGNDNRFGNETFAYTSAISDSIVTTGIESSISPITPASIASENTTVVVTSTNSNGAVTNITTTSTSPIISTTVSSQPGPVTVETENATSNSLGSTVVATSTNVSITTAIETSTYPIIPASVASGTTTVVIASTKSNGTLTTVITTTSTTGSSQPGPVTVETDTTTTENSLGSTLVAPSTYVSIATATTTSALQTETSATPRGSNNGGLAVSSRSSPTKTPSPATNGSPITTTKSGVEPTYSNISPTCSDNNTYYIDRFGLQYDIKCGLSFHNADVALVAHTDTFEGCIQYCSLLQNCAGVSFQDANCHPLANFRGYMPEAAAEGTDLLTAVPTDGHNNGSITPDDLCAEGFDGQNYTDKFQCSWGILCDQTVGGAALQQTVQTNFEACINYCAFYDGCESVYFEGTGGSASSLANASVNCFPMSSIGAVSQDTNVSAAFLQGTCNWPGNQ